MRIAIPGLKTKHVIRLFERVETVNGQYDIFDVGLESPEGLIDSVVIGGAFSSAKEWLATDKKEEVKAEVTEASAEVSAT